MLSSIIICASGSKVTRLHTHKSQLQGEEKFDADKSTAKSSGQPQTTKQNNCIEQQELSLNEQHSKLKQHTEFSGRFSTDVCIIRTTQTKKH